MATVALIGADGAGKTTITRDLETANGHSLRIKSIYMGVNPEAANHMLPTTRLLRAVKRALGKQTHQGGPPGPTRQGPAAGSVLRRALRSLKSALRLGNQVAEECYRLGLAWYYQRRGYVVLFDRHFYSDYYAHDIAGDRLPLARRIHGTLLRGLHPKPDLVVLLDAPAEVLYARKAEGTVELLEVRRREYLRLRDRFPRFTIVDAARPREEVTREVLEIVRELHGSGRSA